MTWTWKGAHCSANEGATLKKLRSGAAAQLGPERTESWCQVPATVVVVADRRFLTGLGGSCMGHVFQNFQGTGIPRAGALSNKRNKFDPLLLTGLGRVDKT